MSKNKEYSVEVVDTKEGTPKSNMSKVLDVVVENKDLISKGLEFTPEIINGLNRAKEIDNEFQKTQNEHQKNMAELDRDYKERDKLIDNATELVRERFKEGDTESAKHIIDNMFKGF